MGLHDKKVENGIGINHRRDFRKDKGCSPGGTSVKRSNLRVREIFQVR